MGLPRWYSDKESTFQYRKVGRDVGSSPASGRSPRTGNGNPLQYSNILA